MMIVDIEAFLAVLTQRSNDRPLTNRIHESVRLRLRSEELDMNIDLPRDPSFASAREQLSGKLQPNGINAMTAESPPRHLRPRKTGPRISLVAGNSRFDYT